MLTDTNTIHEILLKGHFTYLYCTNSPAQKTISKVSQNSVTFHDNTNAEFKNYPVNKKCNSPLMRQQQECVQ